MQPSGCECQATSQVWLSLYRSLQQHRRVQHARGDAMTGRRWPPGDCISRRLHRYPVLTSSGQVLSRVLSQGCIWEEFDCLPVGRSPGLAVGRLWGWGWGL